MIVTGCVGAACADNAAPGPSEDVLSQVAPLIVDKLYFEGTCQYLACCNCSHEHATTDPGTQDCSGYDLATDCPVVPSCKNTTKSHVARDGYHYAPNFKCREDDTACSDSEEWLVMPHAERGDCGRVFTICLKGKRVQVAVKDRSNSHNLWEGSRGLFVALGVGELSQPTVHIYADPEDPAIRKDETCGTCAPACMKPTLDCAPVGSCVHQLDTPTQQAICWANGVVSHAQGFSTTVSKGGKVCYSSQAHINGDFTMDITYSDGAGSPFAIIHKRDLSDPNKLTIECTVEQKSYDIDLSTPACAELRAMFPSAEQCETGVCP